MGDGSLKVREIASVVGILIVHIHTFGKIRNHVMCSKYYLQFFLRNAQMFCHCSVTVDETWLDSYTREAKGLSKQRVSSR